MSGKQYVLDHFGTIWPAHVSSFTWFLAKCRKQFSGDLDLMLVLATIGDRTLAARHVPADMTYEQFVGGQMGHVPVEPINIQSVADFLGMPKETVRRKINSLIDLGWVERDANGALAATAKAARELAPLTDEGVDYLGRMWAILSAVSSKS